MGRYSDLAVKLAARVKEEAVPGSAHVHLIPGSGGPLIFLPNGSRLFRGSAEQTAFVEGVLKGRGGSSSLGSPSIPGALFSAGTSSSEDTLSSLGSPSIPGDSPSARTSSSLGSPSLLDTSHSAGVSSPVHLSSSYSSFDDASILLGLLGMGIDGHPLIDDTIPSPPLHALSLAISQSCNMGCSYCYAGQGEFGTGAASSMNVEMALKAIDLLLKDKVSGDKVQLSFLGGEPLMNRAGIRMATAYAASQGAAKGVEVGFSITSNGTLIRQEDASFFEEYGFAVTISLDGLQEEHDRIRTLKNGRGTYDQIMENIAPLLAMQRRMQVSARVTVTPMNVCLTEALDTFIEMGFHSVGFSPLLRADNGANEMSADDLEHLLAEMIACGLQFENAVLNGKRYPFLNMVNAYKEIAKGTHRPYPCGAGAGYLGVAANGELAACHRFVNDKRAGMGHVDKGVDSNLQQAWLSERHVHQQVPCNGCWARYLCGGGCHHEVLERGRGACDYIRGWLHFTLQSYERINRLMPGYGKV